MDEVCTVMSSKVEYLRMMALSPMTGLFKFGERAEEAAVMEENHCPTLTRKVQWRQVMQYYTSLMHSVIF